MSNNSRLACPNCNESIYVQKVSAIYSNGTHTSTFFSPGTTVTFQDGKPNFGTTLSTGRIRSSTNLAERFSPPQPPLKPSAPSKIAFGWVIVILDALAFIYSYALVFSRPNGMYSGIVGICAASHIAMLMGGLINIWLGNDEYTEKKNNYPQLLSKYQQAKEIWDNLYYCHRCDIAYDSSDGYVFSDL